MSARSFFCLIRNRRADNNTNNEMNKGASNHSINFIRKNVHRYPVYMYNVLSYRGIAFAIELDLLILLVIFELTDCALYIVFSHAINAFSCGLHLSSSVVAFCPFAI